MGPGGGGSGHRGNINIKLTPKDERDRSSDDIAQTPGASCRGCPVSWCGAQPRAASKHARHAGGGNQGGDGSRLGRNPRPRARRLEAAGAGRQDAARLDTGIADSRVGREEGRPEIAYASIATRQCLASVTGVANTIRTTPPALRPRCSGRREMSTHRRAAARRGPHADSVGRDVLLSNPLVRFCRLET